MRASIRTWAARSWWAVSVIQAVIVGRRIVEEQLRALPMEIDADKVYVQHNRLMREFTPIAHKVQLASPAGVV